jgi:hypothetical protein
MSVTDYYRKGGAWQEIGGGTVNPPPPAQLDIIYGSNIGWAKTVSGLITEMNPQIIRVYSTPSDTENHTTWANGTAGPVPDTLGVSWTIKPNVQSWQTGNANYSTEVAKWRTILGGAPATQLIWFGIWHEPWDNTPNGGGNVFTIDEWKEMNTNFRADVIDYVNASRTYPILFNCNLHGESATGHLVGGEPSINTFLTTDMMDVFHEVSFDTYSTDHTPAWDDWMSVNGQGKRYGIWEMGYNLGGGTDVQVLDRMKFAVETQFPSLTNPLSYVCWFNTGGTDGNHNSITNGRNPDALTYWKTLCDNSPKATQEVYFNGYNP